MNNEESVYLEGRIDVAGTRGYSAYEVAQQNGFVGTEEEWLESLVGPTGPQGPQGTPFDELTDAQKAEIKGDDGDSAYDIAVEQGFTGTKEEWLESLIGPQGERGYQGLPGQDGRGIVSIEKQYSIGLKDVYLITYTDETTSILEVTNGEVTEEELTNIQNDLQNKIDCYRKVFNALPKETSSGYQYTLDNTVEGPLEIKLYSPDMSQNKDNLIYRCSGSESGDYYFVVLDTNYGFTMPTISEGDILVFNSSTSKLFYNDTEISLTQLSSTEGYSLISLLETPNIYYEVQPTIPDLTGVKEITLRNANILTAAMFKNIASKNSYVTYGGQPAIKVWGITGAMPLGINFKENTSYSLVMRYLGTTMGTNNDLGSLQWQYTDGQNATMAYYTGTYEKGIKRYTSNGSKTLIGIRLQAWAASQAIYVSTKGLKLVEGSQDYDGLEHEEQTYNLELGNLSLHSMPNSSYKDCIVYKDNKWYLRKYVEKLTFNGTETWTLFNAGNHVFKYNNYILYKQNEPAICNYFNITSATATANLNDCEIMLHQYGDIYLRVNAFSTVSDLTDWLSTHNVDLYFILDYPEDIEITDNTLLTQLNALVIAHSYDKQTYVKEAYTNSPIIIETTVLKDNLVNEVNDNG